MKSRAFRRTRGVFVLCGLTLGVVTVQATALGATYRVYSCNAPGGVTVGSDGWQRSSVTTDTSAQISLDCRSGGPRFTTGPTTHPRGAELGVEFRPAADTTVVGLRLNHSVFMPGDQADTWAWEYAVSAVDAGTGERFRFATCVWPSTSCAQHTSFEAEGIHTYGRRMSVVQVSAICSAGLMHTSNCPSSPAPSLSVTSSAFTIEDVAVPEIVEPPSGSLLNQEAPISGLAQVLVKAHDDGGGLLSATVEVDGVPVANESFDKGDGRCVPPFATPMPCPRDATKLLSLDTATLTDGTHSVLVRVLDATGKNAASVGPWSITTSNRPASPQPVDVTPSCATRSRDFRLAAHPQVATRERKILLTGRVPARLRPSTTRVVLFGDVPEGIRQDVVPNQRGRFRARVPVRTAQKVRAAAMGTTSEPLACSKARPIRIRASTTLRASRTRLSNGQALELGGRLAGRPVPREGKVVRIKVRAVGSSRWYAAGEVRSDAEGRWRWRHRFTNTLRTTTYVFRVVLPKQRGYPYARGASRVIRVRVGG